MTTRRPARRGVASAAVSTALAVALVAGAAMAVVAAAPGRAQSTTTTSGRQGPLGGQTCVTAAGAAACVDLDLNPESTTTTSPDGNDDDQGDDGGSDGENRPEDQAFDPGAEENTSPCPQPPMPPPASPPASLTLPPELRVAAGETGALPIRLHLPARPTPVDLFFVVDTSGSMDDVIDDLRTSIDRTGEQLRAAGIDVWVGLAEFSDRAQRPYRRLVSLGPLDCRMGRALVEVRTSGGEEPHLLALHQAVRGSGAPAVPGGWAVPPGRHATFRPGALHLVFHATDEPVRDDLPSSPARARVAAAFAAANAKHIGIHALDVTSAPSELPVVEDQTRRSLDAFGAATKSLAPPGGIDCTGDGSVDVAEGAPMTCAIGGLVVVEFGERETTFGHITSQVVKALRSTTDVTLRVAGEGAPALGAAVGTPVRPLDLAATNVVDDTLSLRCPTLLGAGATPERTVAVEALVAGAVVARGTTVVTCVGPAGARRTRPPVGAALAPAPAPAAQGVQAPASANAPAAATAVASAPAPAPVVGLAVAPGSQPQLAFQEAARSGDDGDRGDDALRSLGAAGMFAGAAVLARRRLTAPAHARRR